jgi:hypothetical protein
MDRILMPYNELPPNPPMQPTPLRVDKIVAFLKRSTGPRVFLIY